MYICICKAVSDRQIREAVQDGACSMRELHARLGVAATCGRCAPSARELLMAYLHEVERGNNGPQCEALRAQASLHASANAIQNQLK